MHRALVAALVAFAAFALVAPAMAVTPPAPPATTTITPTAPQPPPPMGTPWPAPSGLTVGVGPAAILNPDGSFIPPDQRVYKASATWGLATGFTGRYEVEIARRSRSDAAPLAFVPQGVVEASAARDGSLRVEENTTFLDSLNSQFCFRVRTVTGSSPNTHETGPYAMACSILAPSSGGGAVVPPGPPSVGTGTQADGSGRSTTWSALLGLGAAAVVSVSLLRVRRARQRSINCRHKL